MRPSKPTPHHISRRNHKAVGEYSEAIIKARLIEVGYSVYTPLGDNLRCDLVIEDADGQFWRIQCKTGWIDKKKSIIKFATVSTYYHTKAGRTGHGRKDYRGQIDYFAVYCDETQKVYLISIDEVGTSEAVLRLIPTANNQEKFVRWAKDYEL